MSTVPSLPEVSEYRLRLLFSNVSELLSGSQNNLEGPSGSGTIEVRCAQALGVEIYVGCSDGSLLRYAYDNSIENSAEPETYRLLTHQYLVSGKAIDRIALVPSIQRALILCDTQIYLFTLPNLEPVQNINPIRRVVTFALDENPQRKSLPDRSRHPSQPDGVRLCVITPSLIRVFILGDRLLFQKEIPLPNGATLGRLSNKHLCIADSVNYNIIDIETAKLIPLIPLSQTKDVPDVPVMPSITVITESEFLLLSSTGMSTLGVFITGEGDPVRGTLQWEAHPTAICCNYPYVTSVLPKGAIEVYNLDIGAVCQTILLPSGFTPLRLEKSSTGLVVPYGEQFRKLDVVNFPLLEPESPDTSAVEEESTDEGRRELTQTPVPSRSESLNVTIKKHRPSLQRLANLLIVGEDSMYTMATPLLVQRADELLEGHKLKEVAALAQEQQKRISQLQGTADVAQLTAELHYIYQRLGYTCLTETSFEDAGIHLFRGNVDPRMLIRLFSTLRGTLLSSTKTLPAFSGVVSQIRMLSTVDAIIVMNLVKNYTPHLQPNTRSAPSTSELRKLLAVSAQKMLRGYLYKWKNKVLYGGERVIKEVSQAIDTVLAKLLAESEDTEELYALVESSDDIVAEEVEETLIRSGQYNALIKLYRRRGRNDKLLSIFAKLVEGEWTDEHVRDPLGQMTHLLNETSDRALIQRWSLWLIKLDAEAGLKLLMSGDNKRGAKVDDAALLKKLEGVSPEASQRFLEYLVLEKHTDDAEMHTRLALILVESLVSSLQLDEVLEYFRDIVLEYSIQNVSTPFLVYLASVAKTSPYNEHVRTRCSAALFLQGSALYDAALIRDKLKAWEETIGFEIAILDGKLGHHNEALRALVHTLRDTTSADAYCALGGCPVPPKVAQAIGDQLGLGKWAALVVEGSKLRGGSRRARGSSQKNLEHTRHALLKVLLEVYMSGGDATEAHAARLLNSQGGNFDVLDVVSLIPPSWSLSTVSSFLTRSFRRTVHERCEGEILKAICLGQNLEVQDNAFTSLRAQGAVIEEPIPGSQPSTSPSDGPDRAEEGMNEKVIVVSGSDSTTEKPIVDEVRLEGVEEVERTVGPEGIEGDIT